jgi:hypothetical protein
MVKAIRGAETAMRNRQRAEAAKQAIPFPIPPAEQEQEQEQEPEPPDPVEIPLPPPGVQRVDVQEAEGEASSRSSTPLSDIPPEEEVGKVPPVPEESESVEPVTEPPFAADPVVLKQIQDVRFAWKRNRYKFIRQILADNKMFKFAVFPPEMLDEIKAGAEDYLQDDRRMVELIQYLNSLKTSSDTRRKMKMLQFLLVMDSILRIVKRGGFKGDDYE